VGEGDKIGRADVIGFLGNTGRSTGPHLHYEIIYKNEPINPTQVLAVLRK
jgi:murein DD-endopeptidase MepM/ murein hydrolase activator NlpD